MSPYKALAYMITFIASNNPFAHAHVLWRLSDAAAATTDNEIARPVVSISAHALNNAAMDDGVCGNVACFALGKRPADGFPGIIFLKVHAPEGQVFHNVPRYDAHAGCSVVELQDIVDSAFGGGFVEVVMKVCVWPFLVVEKDVVVVGVASHTR